MIFLGFLFWVRPDAFNRPYEVRWLSTPYQESRMKESKSGIRELFDEDRLPPLSRERQKIVVGLLALLCVPVLRSEMLRGKGEQDVR